MHQLWEKSSWAEIHGLLATTSHPGLSVALEDFIAAIGPILSDQGSRTRSAILAGLGRAFIKLFHFFVDLYVPDTPLDPAVSRQCEHAFWSAESENLSEQLTLHTELERRTTSNQVNGVVNYLRADLEEAHRNLCTDHEEANATSRSVARLREY